MAPSTQETVVFNVVRLPSGSWRLETSGGDIGGLFVSKHAALTYACGQAEWCHAPSVRIEVDCRRSARSAIARSTASAA